MWTALPQELLQTIFGYLDVPTLQSVRLVCRAFRSALTPATWSLVAKRKWIIAGEMQVRAARVTLALTREKSAGTVACGMGVVPILHDPQFTPLAYLPDGSNFG